MPLLFQANLHSTVWGGHRLPVLKGQAYTDEPVGESWEVSILPANDSVVATGVHAGQPLSSLIARYGAALVGRRVAERYGSELPLLVKFIDAEGDLSIQVHPGDRMAQERHGCMGKTEMWYVVEARPGASVLVGFERPLSASSYAAGIADGSFVHSLARYAVHAGDVFFIPAGRVHAICAGTLLCEVQQSSDVTYRIFDYHRRGLDGQPRQLHVEEAREAIDFSVHTDNRVCYDAPRQGRTGLVACESFEVQLLCARSPLHCDRRSADSFVVLSCVAGCCRVEVDAALGASLSGQAAVELTAGNSCLVPAAEAAYTVVPLGEGGVRVLEAVAR